MTGNMCLSICVTSPTSQVFLCAHVCVCVFFLLFRVDNSYSLRLFSFIQLVFSYSMGWGSMKSRMWILIACVCVCVCVGLGDYCVYVCVCVMCVCVCVFSLPT